MRDHPWLLLAWTVLGAASAAQAELRFANIFNDHRVLQRDKPLRVWGWAEPGAKVTILVTEDRAEAAAAAGEEALKRAQEAPRPDAPRVHVTCVQDDAPRFKARSKQLAANQAGLRVAEFEPMAASFTPNFTARSESVGPDDIVEKLLETIPADERMYDGATTG